LKDFGGREGCSQKKESSENKGKTHTEKMTQPAGAVFFGLKEPLRLGNLWRKKTRGQEKKKEKDTAEDLKKRERSKHGSTGLLNLQRKGKKKKRKKKEKSIFRFKIRRPRGGQKVRIVERKGRKTERDIISVRQQKEDEFYSK